MYLRNRLARTPPNNRRKTGNEGSHPIGEGCRVFISDVMCQGLRPDVGLCLAGREAETFHSNEHSCLEQHVVVGVGV